ncbi:MAG: GDP-mannose 4,6-dehydratase [Gemmataceae bacterium]|nr:GDP-mannose 4,6-dehydratase [Gemmataceae bacterium]
MRVLVTGATGFAGGYLAEALAARDGTEIHGASRRGAWPEHWCHLARQTTLHPCDLGQRAAVETLLRAVQPEQIYHLAGFSRTGQSYREPDAAWADNLTATRNLFEATIHWGGRPRILHVSSALVYGDPRRGTEIVDESGLLQPVSPYASSKAAADLAAYQYSRVPGLAIVRARPFNHIGPRQSGEFAVSNFARQIAAAEQGRQPPIIETGDLSPRRDLTDVRDMIQAYVLLMDKGVVGEVYNAGSGQAHSMQAVLDRLRALARVAVEVRQRTEPDRAAEALALQADCRKLRGLTGWQPRYALDQTLADTLEYWRSSGTVAPGRNP